MLLYRISSSSRPKTHNLKSTYHKHIYLFFIIYQEVKARDMDEGYTVGKP